LVPDVKIIMNVSSGPTSRCGTKAGAAAEQIRPLPGGHVEDGHPGKVRIDVKVVE